MIDSNQIVDKHFLKPVIGTNCFAILLCMIICLKKLIIKSN